MWSCSKHDEMDSEPGRSLIVWTIRLSVALYAWSLFTYVKTVHRKSSVPHSDQYIWTAAWILCVAHVLCAFHIEHRWSHQKALQHTAEITASVTGLNWSIGLYLNYLFLIAWGVDVAKRLSSPATTTSFTFHLIAAFMMLNATAVFGPRFWVPVVIVYAVILWRSLVVAEAEQ